MSDRRFIDRLRLEAKEVLRQYRERFLAEYRRDELEREKALKAMTNEQMTNEQKLLSSDHL